MSKLKYEKFISQFTWALYFPSSQPLLVLSGVLLGYSGSSLFHSSFFCFISFPWTDDSPHSSSNLLIVPRWHSPLYFCISFISYCSSSQSHRPVQTIFQPFYWCSLLSFLLMCFMSTPCLPWLWKWKGAVWVECERSQFLKGRGKGK